MADVVDRNGRPLRKNDHVTVELDRGRLVLGRVEDVFDSGKVLVVLLRPLRELYQVARRSMSRLRVSDL